MKLFHSGEKRSGGEREELVARLRELQALPALPGVGYEEEIAKVQGRLESLEGLGSPTAAWKTVSMARAQNRPQVLITSRTWHQTSSSCTETGWRSDDPLSLEAWEAWTVGRLSWSAIRRDMI